MAPFLKVRKEIPVKMKPIRGCAVAGVALACVMALLAVQPAQAQTYKEKVLYSFCSQSNCTDGANPDAGVIQDAKGNLYGTTQNRGDSDSNCDYGGGCGVVFKLSKAGKETVLYTFTGPPDGSEPVAGVIQDAKGNLYGTTDYGGASGNYGTVFEVSKTGKETVLYSFPGGVYGAYPSGVIQDSKGNLYGTTYVDGAYYAGTVFKLSKAGKETVLYNFCAQSGCADGEQPWAGVIRDAQGNFYGTTTNGGASGAGTVFKLSKTSKETVLYSFTGGSGGATPYAGLILDAKGNLYGTTYNGGASGVGTVFKLSKTGKETVLYSFTGGTDGASPYAGLILDAKGNLYGTTFYGGAYGAGTVFKLSKTGKETVLHSFTGGTDGKNPYADLIQDPKGNLYGTTFYGGAYGSGTVFELMP